MDGSLGSSLSTSPGTVRRDGPSFSLKAIHWLWDQDNEEKASTLFGGLAGPGPWDDSRSLGGRVMGALWARGGAGLRAAKGLSGTSHGEVVEEEGRREASLGVSSSANGE